MRRRIKPKSFSSEYELPVEFEVWSEKDQEGILFEADFLVDYDFDPGQRERGPTYDCGGEPGYPPQVTVNAVVFANTVHVNGVFYARGMEINEDCSLFECALNLEKAECLEERILLDVMDNDELFI